MLFVLLLFIRISLIFSKIYSGSHAYLVYVWMWFWYKRKAAKAHSTDKQKRTKPPLQEVGFVRPSFCPMGFSPNYLCMCVRWLLFRFYSLCVCVFVYFIGATDFLLPATFYNATCWTRIYGLHEATYKQNHFTAPLIESMILTNNFICSHWQYFLIYTQSHTHNHNIPTRLRSSLSLLFSRRP